MHRSFFILGAVLFCLPLAVFGRPFVVRSNAHQVHLVELYTSSSCARCDRAEAILSELRSRRRLWTYFVPLQFRLPDRDNVRPGQALGQPNFASRQADYKNEWGSRGNESPLFILDGQHWTPTGTPVERSERLEKRGPLVGVLSVRQTGKRLFRMHFRPVSRQPQWFGYGAILGNGPPNQRQFLALSLVQTKLEKAGNVFRGNLEFPPPSPSVKSAGLSAVFWVSQVHQVRPEQAVGGDLVVRNVKKRSHKP